MGPKIATCSYCGTRAALVFDKGRHELVCSSCGAPLHDIKMMPQHARNKKENAIQGRPERYRRKTRENERKSSRNCKPAFQKRRVRKPGRKPLGRRILEEIWDTVEDVFD